MLKVWFVDKNIGHFTKNSSFSWPVGTHFEEKFQWEKLFRIIHSINSQINVLEKKWGEQTTARCTYATGKFARSNKKEDVGCAEKSLARRKFVNLVFSKLWKLHFQRIFFPQKHQLCVSKQRNYFMGSAEFIFAFFLATNPTVAAKLSTLKHLASKEEMWSQYNCHAQKCKCEKKTTTTKVKSWQKSFYA